MRMTLLSARIPALSYLARDPAGLSEKGGLMQRRTRQPECLLAGLIAMAGVLMALAFSSRRAGAGQEAEHPGDLRR
jgi:hypothetical protein